MTPTDPAPTARRTAGDAVPREVRRDLARVHPLGTPDGDVIRFAGVPLTAPAGPARAAVRGAPGPVPPDDPARRELAYALYRSWYLRPPGSPPGVPGAPGATAADPRTDLVPLLRAAHAGAERLEEGWVVVATAPDGSCQVTRDGRWRTVRPGDYVSIPRPGVPVAPGEVVAVRARDDWGSADDEFWCTADPAGGPAPPLGRAYLHVRPDSVGPVLHGITAALAATGLRYALKCPRDARAYDRVDTLVVYHARDDARRVRAALEALHPALVGQALLRDATPPLARRVGPGLAYADDPEGRPSFGEHRCAALVPGLLAAAAAGVFHGRAGDRDRRRDLLVDHLLAALRAAGVDPERPWREPRRRHPATGTTGTTGTTAGGAGEGAGEP
ncbi:T3SS effector HopA1 family protein [Allostreptomyces psammosilenae]|uniref:Uncharacterized protein n=1 Tax=Allostreptomyces psammosilenae TaxID=1892865 RepID=A0A852ZRJ0_9ACTN|nr:T3SS effector HopA1 family protein [Allostreptomyces psammosilenae]NYI04395.1 hypothetical protein [Allostreptomyces psammosilenae]